MHKNTHTMLFDRQYAIQTLRALKSLEGDTEMPYHIKKNYLIRSISHCENVKTETINEYITVIQDLVDMTKQNNDSTEIIIDDLSSFLYSKKPETYRYTDQNVALANLHPITDSDFIFYHDYSNNARRLIYDILYNDHNGVSVCDTLTYYCSCIDNEISRKVNLQYWHNCFQQIIDILSKKIIEEYCIVLPFLDTFSIEKNIGKRIASSREEYEEQISNISYNSTPYKKNAKYVIDLFRMAQDATLLLRSSGHLTGPLNYSKKVVTLKPIDIIFEAWEKFLRAQNKNEEAKAVHGERIRRGFIDGDCSQNPNYRTLFITPGFHDEHSDNLTIDDLFDASTSEEREKKKFKAGVLVGMLKSEPNIPDYIIKRIVHYSISKPEDFKGDNHNSTAYQYCQNLEGQLYSNGYRNQLINGILKTYGFGEDVVERLVAEERKRKKK